MLSPITHLTKNCVFVAMVSAYHNSTSIKPSAHAQNKCQFRFRTQCADSAKQSHTSSAVDPVAFSKKPRILHVNKDSNGCGNAVRPRNILRECHCCSMTNTSEQQTTRTKDINSTKMGHSRQEAGNERVINIFDPNHTSH
jgi:hypothetical protein